MASQTAISDHISFCMKYNHFFFSLWRNIILIAFTLDNTIEIVTFPVTAFLQLIQDTGNKGSMLCIFASKKYWWCSVYWICTLITVVSPMFQCPCEIFLFWYASCYVWQNYTIYSLNIHWGPQVVEMKAEVLRISDSFIHFYHALLIPYFIIKIYIFFYWWIIQVSWSSLL